MHVNFASCEILAIASLQRQLTTKGSQFQSKRKDGACIDCMHDLPLTKFDDKATSQLQCSWQKQLLSESYLADMGSQDCLFPLAVTCTKRSAFLCLQPKGGLH